MNQEKSPDEIARNSATWFVFITTAILICVAAWKGFENQRSKESKSRPAATIQAAPEPRTPTEKRRALVKKWHAEGSKIPSPEAQILYRLITYESVTPESFGFGEGETYRLLNARDKLTTGDGYFTSSP